MTTVARTALRGVRVFDGRGLTEPCTVVIDGAVIGADATGAEVVDAAETSTPAKHFGLADRGAVEPGLRADLVLVDGDPLADISATRAIRRVWPAGVESVR